MYCVYCGEEHPESVEFNDEHIIPRALGGPDNFVTRVCKKSNSTLGNDVDRPFLELFPVITDRFINKMESHRGLPLLDLSGRTWIDGTERTLTYQVRGTDKTFKLDPLVTTTFEDGKKHVTLSGDPGDAEKILLGMLESAERLGQKITDEQGAIITRERIQEMILDRVTVHEKPSVLMELRIDPVSSVRFFCKVALAVGFYSAGEEFGRSHTATKLRESMGYQDLDGRKLPGRFWPLDSGPENLYQFFRVQGSHIIAIAPGREFVIISLVGGKYISIIPLTEGRARGSAGSEFPGTVYQITFDNRHLVEMPYVRYLEARLLEKNVPPTDQDTKSNS